MQKSHAAGWTSDSPTPAQLKEFFTQIDPKVGKVTRERLQTFLRGRGGTTAPTVNQTPERQWEGDELLGRIEEFCQSEFPDRVDAVLEVVRPFCARDLSFELMPPPTQLQLMDGEGPWARVREIFHGGQNYHFDVQCVDHEHPVADEVRPQDRLTRVKIKQFYADLLTTLDHLHPRLPEFRRMVVSSELLPSGELPGHCYRPSLAALIAEQAGKTTVHIYGLVPKSTTGELAKLCCDTLEIAVALAATGDEVRGGRVRAFLDLLRIGNWPLYCYSPAGEPYTEVSVLCRPYGYQDHFGPRH